MHAGGCTHARKHRFVALVAQTLKRKVAAEALIGFDRHAHALDHADLERENLARQTVRGNGLHRHAAGRDSPSNTRGR